MKKTTTKKTVKKAKDCGMVINLTGNKDINETLSEFSLAKIRAGLPITIDELVYIQNNWLKFAEAIMFSWNNAVIKAGNEYFKAVIQECPDEEKCKCCECEEKKPNIFRRLWNWVTNKK